MYNYQTYLKQNKIQKKFDQIKRDYYETLQLKQSTFPFMSENQPSLVNSHKKRIEGFILAMIEKPQPVNTYQDLHYEPRSPSKSHSIHEKSFHLNHLTEKQRIQVFTFQCQDNSNKNSVCDTVPFNNTFSHRFRDFKDQSSLKPMRYKSINSGLRIKEQLESSTLNYLPNLTNKKIDKLATNPNVSWKDKNNVKKLNKSLLPMMHKKNYYQSLKSLFAQCPNGFMRNLRADDKDIPFSKTQDYVLFLMMQEYDLEMSSKKQKGIQGQNKNRKQNSRQALIKCGLLGGQGNAYVIGMQNTSKKVFPMSNSLNIRI